MAETMSDPGKTGSETVPLGRKFAPFLATTNRFRDTAATILGGQETGVNEYPSMAGLVNLNPFIIICGASIISEFFVLTAGHCVYNRDRSTFSVLVGGHNITSGQETGVNEYPSMAGLVNLNPFIIICGASIISEFFVLTAGHCVYNRDRSTFSVLVGGHNITSGNKIVSSATNLELCVGNPIQVCRYINAYVNKGLDVANIQCVEMQVNTTTGTIDWNEAAAFLKMRYIGPHEAVYRILGNGKGTRWP
ncbi:venom serine protease-like [Cylas formicarius]|uniref:venom serine protease-like n=1 Tax=Cylas formicarius TaxID=197179 RepID=UPI002958DAB9|nr:venom serine protease-like [Cylas formicarius]